MFNNLISFREIPYLIHRVRREPQLLAKILTKLHLHSRDRVLATWAESDRPPTQWWDIPAVQRRWNHMITGDEQRDYHDYVTQKYWPGKTGLIGLSFGCGTGEKELLWAATNSFRRIDAYDLSAPRIETAKKVAALSPSGHVMNFIAADVYAIEAKENCYDVLFGESSLHHFTPLKELLQRAEHFLKPGGFFIVNEFIGPTRFQWTDRQLEAINGLLAVIPNSYKTLLGSTYTKLPVIKPSKLSMIISDPSEAVESSRIMPLLHELFDVVEVKGYGGSILQMLFSGISQHFLSPDGETERVLELCFKTEDLLIASGEIPHDFVLAVCRKRTLR